MRRSLLFGLSAATLAAAQQSVSVFTVVVPGLSTESINVNALSTKIDTVTWVNNVTTTTVYVCPSSSKIEESTVSSIALSPSSSSSEAQSSAIPSTTVATANTTTSPPSALPTAAGEHINFEGSMMGLVVFCALGLLIL